MSYPETKNCPKCRKPFECNPGNITLCQCNGIELTAELRAYIEQRYNDCLCRDCLQYLQQELVLFKEKYFFR
jgi:hypothetical protein